MKAVMSQTKLLGVFGCPIEHSLSPAMHNAALQELGLDYVYLAFNVDPQRLESAVGAIRALDIVGVNVTIPHKENVIRFLDEVSPEAERIGSVNTISNTGGRLRGETTDGEGFLRGLEAAGADIRGKRAVVLGAGGSARAVLYSLVKRGAGVTIINRTAERGEKLAREINELTSPGAVQSAPMSPDNLKEAVERADLLVNCTSVGMWPNVNESPCPEQLLHPGLLVYDLVYNPPRTELMQAAERAGASAISGLKMLVYQGAASLNIWTGSAPPVDVMEAAAVSALTQRRLEENPAVE